jgi:hypothetical protein
VVFIYKIPVYSISYKEHEQHLRNMLQTLRENKLCAKLDKCEFWLKNVVLLGHVYLWLTCKEVRFVWSKEREESFQELKGRLTSASVLVLPSGT